MPISSVLSANLGSEPNPQSQSERDSWATVPDASHHKLVLPDLSGAHGPHRPLSDSGLAFSPKMKSQLKVCHAAIIRRLISANRQHVPFAAICESHLSCHRRVSKSYYYPRQELSGIIRETQALCIRNNGNNNDASSRITVATRAVIGETDFCIAFDSLGIGYIVSAGTSNSPVIEYATAIATNEDTCCGSTPESTYFVNLVFNEMPTFDTPGGFATMQMFSAGTISTVDMLSGSSSLAVVAVSWPWNWTWPWPTPTPPSPAKFNYLTLAQPLSPELQEVRRC